MKINTNYISPYITRQSAANFYNTKKIDANNLHFKGLRANEGNEELLRRVFKDKKEAYEIVAKEKNLDIFTEKKDGRISVTISDIDTDEVLKTIEYDNPDDIKFQLVLKRSVLLANAHRNLYAANALLTKYSEGLPEVSKKTSEAALMAAKSELDRASQMRADLKTQLVLQTHIKESHSPEYADFLLKEKNIRPVTPKDLELLDTLCSQMQTQVDLLDFTNEYGQEAGSRSTTVAWKALLEGIRI